jgi:GTPase SAR1 family protein
VNYMDTVEEKLESALYNAANLLRSEVLPGNPALFFEKLTVQVTQPCVVAVVGQVKAGKSTFINALLHDDLAKVGTDETTATINYFCYSRSRITSDKPIRCFWRDGGYRDVALDFLNSLQGNEIETLREAEKIDRLVYYLPNPDLQHVTLVDTPGTESVVDEHQGAVAEYMRLRKQLRERHNEKTKEFGDTADAVIYLIKAVAGSADQKFLEEFAQLTQGPTRAFNAIGVIAKIDLYPETVERRTEMAAKIATQLHESLNTVVPVSASMRRALDSLEANDNAGLKRIIEAMRSLPPEKLNKYLRDKQLYLMPDTAGPISLEQRKSLLGTMEWRVFATIARFAADTRLDVQGVQTQLDEIAGFDLLKTVLERHIFQRSRLLRCYRIVLDARQKLGTLHYLPAVRQCDREELEKLNRYLMFVQRAGGNPAVAEELKAFLRQHLAHRTEQIEAKIQTIEQDFDVIFHELVQYNADFDALDKVSKNPGIFPAEIDELQKVLGLHGMEVEKRLPTEQISPSYVRTRQRVWREISMYDQQPIRREVAEQVVKRYGFILKELTR